MVKGRGWPKKKAPEAVASFDGHCPECSDDIEEGDTIVKDEFDNWICEHCARLYELI